jgi:hypothetical protein
MSEHHHQNGEAWRTWLSGLVVSVSAVVAYMAFWHLAPVVTFSVGCITLVALILVARHYGRQVRMDRQRGK